MRVPDDQHICCFCGDAPYTDAAVKPPGEHYWECRDVRTCSDRMEAQGLGRRDFYGMERLLSETVAGAASVDREASIRASMVTRKHPTRREIIAGIRGGGVRLG